VCCGGSEDGTTSHLSAQARAELQCRGIPETLLTPVLAEPEPKMPGHGKIWCDQWRLTRAEKPYLLRAMVDETQQPPIVVTVYRTSTLDTYSSQA
jgi:hypothetical protein